MGYWMFGATITAYEIRTRVTSRYTRKTQRWAMRDHVDACDPAIVRAKIERAVWWYESQGFAVRVQCHAQRYNVGV